MGSYLLRRLCYLPLTLFAIVLVNFIILNLAPGDPSSLASLSATGDATKQTHDAGVTGENQYLLFREHYGLTLPILWNTWPYLTAKEVERGLATLESATTMSVDAHHKLRTLWGDRARFIMPILLQEASHPQHSVERKKLATHLFIRGGIKQGHVGAMLSSAQQEENRQISQSNMRLGELSIHADDTEEVIAKKISGLHDWYATDGQRALARDLYTPKWKLLLFETRFCRYLSRVVKLDFGTLRNDQNKSVISEVGKRMKYSLILAVIPLLFTFALCQLFGMMMAVRQNRWVDHSLNIFFLILFAIPVFVVAPFLIETCALHKTIPFTKIAIPYSGFHNAQEIYSTYTSYQRVLDIMLHIFLPLVAIKYGLFAVQTRLARTAFLEVLRQDYIRTARAKGLSVGAVLWKHVGRNGAITIITSLATSLGVILGGSLIVETIFEINGFGRFFYQAILNRDYNVVLFSAFAGSILSLVGYLIADIAYTLLDPRISLE